MIKIDLPDSLVNKHWIWFKKILDDRQDWSKPRKDQANISNAQKTTRRNFIYRKFNFNNDNQIYELICADFNRMKKFIEDAAYIPKTFFAHNSTRLGHTRTINKSERDEIFRAFGYEEFSDINERFDWGAYTFCKELGVNVCPYCNREYIFTIIKEKKYQPQNTTQSRYNRIIRPQIEHYFPKSIYPYLSCSIYNMIPTCSICNTQKSTTDTYNRTIVYPYEEEFGNDGHFFIRFDQNNLNIPDDSVFEKELEKNIEVKIKPYDGSKLKANIKESIKTLILEDLYNCHQIEIKNILKRYRLSTSSNISRYANMQLDTSFAKEIILGLPIQSRDEYPLRKFSKDIIEQLDDKKTI